MRMISSRKVRMGLMLFCLCLFLPLAAYASDSTGGLVVSVTGDVVVQRGEIDEVVREGYVLREGDTAQFPLVNGYEIETLGEEPSDVIGIAASPSRQEW